MSAYYSAFSRLHRSRMGKRVLLFCAVLSASAPANAGSFANGVSLYSDRIRRGISQTDGPGLVGEIKYNGDGGWLAGLWVGNVNYDNVRGETLELVPFLGYDFTFGRSSAEIGFLHHAYPGANRGIGYDELEIALRHKLGEGTLSAGTYFRGRNEVGGHSWYWFSDARFPFGSIAGAKLGLSFHCGFYRDPVDSRNRYADGSFGISATRGRAILGISLSDTDLSRQSMLPGARHAGMQLSVSFTRMLRHSR